MSGNAAIYYVPGAQRADADVRLAFLMRCTADFCTGRGIPEPDAASLRLSVRGKPFFDQPGAPYFSISHSGDIWAVALCARAVGFDIERVKERNTRAVAARFFSESEQKYALRLGESAFFDIWTAKESYIKLTGQGIDDRFSQISTVNGQTFDGAALGVEFIRPQNVPHGYSACIALTASAT